MTVIGPWIIKLRNPSEWSKNVEENCANFNHTQSVLMKYPVLEPILKVKFLIASGLLIVLLVRLSQLRIWCKVLICVVP